MGQHSGSEHAGAVGKVAVMTRSAVDAGLAVGDELDIADIARPYRQMAIETFVRICEEKKASHSAKVSAAKAILEYSDGKASQRAPQSGSDGGFQIIINNLFTEPRADDPKPTEIVIEAEQVRQEVEDAQTIDAMEVIESVASAMEELDIPLILDPLAKSSEPPEPEHRHGAHIAFSRDD